MLGQLPERCLIPAPQYQDLLLSVVFGESFPDTFSQLDFPLGKQGERYGNDFSFRSGFHLKGGGILQ